MSVFLLACLPSGVRPCGSRTAFGGEMPGDPDYRADDGAYPQEMQGDARDGQRDTQDNPDDHQYKGEENEGVVGFHVATGSRGDAWTGSSLQLPVICGVPGVPALHLPGLIHEPIAAAKLVSRIK